VSKARRDPLFLSDAEIAERLGLTLDQAEVAIRALEEKRGGFPPKNPLFGNKRYWPAVRAYLDNMAGMGINRDVASPGIVENFDGAPDYQRRARPRLAPAR